ncbi:MAG TPA: hypothetical protein VNJ02_17695, partial [Vicinamibacterales bacterium]|nr:hypothetical protein [Vicinamibacterales bacterium]
METNQVELPPLRKVALVLAVAIGVGIAGAYLVQQPGAMAVLRGKVPPPSLVTPKDETTTAREAAFEFRAAGDALRLVVVDLSDGEKVVIDRALIEDGTYAPTPQERATLIAGHEYHWYVETQDSDGRS